MKRSICITCGTQYSLMENEPESCPICSEERQYVNPEGQEWTTLEKMQKGEQFQNQVIEEEQGLYSITTSPSFAIGQTAYIVQQGNFNLLWDCISYLDSQTINQIIKLGGIDAIALSHPHYYSSQVEWAEAFNVPIYIHEDDRQWVMRESEHIRFWRGEELALASGLTIYRLGGHFQGGAVLHNETGNEGKGLLLTGDIIQVVADQEWVSFMYSYPNLIPLPAFKVREMADKIKPLTFNRIYNAFHKIVENGADRAVQHSADRYIQALEGQLFHT
ncbi:MBL fold metallo-hydrolase [Pseudalkalibacillus hwajinpoensis]|uniref:MBL fold metallo-hydrolase n=1 Tax=Guptibacillus hwajinpoensis TaxID=208199 RepID=A0A4U1MP45_9BACL|nr:MBL fold metallo-hydrolase [Pseudalkalibacillus hwajinpoensis]TKD72491.1 MBL fold metallo-hydrolase [Pseudalkalibacillus hwajinpoensis]